MISMEVMRRAEHRRSGQYFGLAAAAWNSAALIAPVAIAAIATITGLRYVWLGSALACVVAAVFMTAAVRMFNGGAHRA
jgi:MFS family permease